MASPETVETMGYLFSQTGIGWAVGGGMVSVGLGCVGSALGIRTSCSQAAGVMSEQPELFGRLAGKALLVHHRATEQSFLDSVCRNLYGSAFIAPMIDTEALARHRFEKRHVAFKPADLRLFNLRRRYGLPAYQAHNALSDSVATAELCLAIVADIQPAMNVRLKEVLYL